MKLLLVFLAFSFSNTALSVEYICPKTPINVEIGKVIKGDWSITLKVDSSTLDKKKLFKQKYYIKHWRNFSGGNITNIKSGPKFYIECCNLINEYGFSICARKKTYEDDCEVIIPRAMNEIEKFICKESAS